MTADPIGGPFFTAAFLAAPIWRRTKCRRGRIGGVEMPAYDLQAETIGGGRKGGPTLAKFAEKKLEKNRQKDWAGGRVGARARAGVRTSVP